MGKRRFTEEQIVTILREADQRPVPEVAKKHRVGEHTLYAWRKRFGALEAVDVRRLRELAAGAPPLGGALGRQAPFFGVREIGEGHGRRDGAVAGLLGD